MGNPTGLIRGADLVVRGWACHFQLLAHGFVLFPLAWLMPSYLATK
jgi:hypothetical protein